MKTKFFLLVVLVLSLSIRGFSSSQWIFKTSNFFVSDEKEGEPEYPGGFQALTKFISDNLKYPEDARKNGVQGKVLIEFVVKKDGSIGKVKVIQGVGSECDKEAVRVVKLMPKWQPGTKDGKPVKVKMTIPINYKLDKKK